jgi:predicted Zn-dependent protease
MIWSQYGDEVMRDGTRPLTLQILALPLVALALVTGCTTVEGTGRERLMFSSLEEDKEIGREVYAEMKQKEEIVTDPVINRMVERVGRRLAAEAPDMGFDYEFTVFKSEQPNAWALPGGKVGIYTGILKYCRNEAGLATVMGHEIAHAIARHGAERQSLGMLQGVGQLAVFGIGLSQDVSQQELGTWMSAYGMATTVGGMLPYSRKHESEADHLGLRYMAKAGYTPMEAPEFWRRFSELSSGTPVFLSTHPASEDRVQELENDLEEAMELYRQAPQQYGEGEMIPAEYLD